MDEYCHIKIAPGKCQQTETGAQAVLNFEAGSAYKDGAYKKSV